MVFFVLQLIFFVCSCGEEVVTTGAISDLISILMTTRRGPAFAEQVTNLRKALGTRFRPDVLENRLEAPGDDGNWTGLMQDLSFFSHQLKNEEKLLAFLDSLLSKFGDPLTIASDEIKHMRKYLDEIDEQLTTLAPSITPAVFDKAVELGRFLDLIEASLHYPRTQRDSQLHSIGDMQDFLRKWKTVSTRSEEKLVAFRLKLAILAADLRGAVKNEQLASLTSLYRVLENPPPSAAQELRTAFATANRDLASLVLLLSEIPTGSGVSEQPNKTRYVEKLLDRHLAFLSDAQNKWANTRAVAFASLMNTFYFRGTQNIPGRLNKKIDRLFHLVKQKIVKSAAQSLTNLRYPAAKADAAGLSEHEKHVMDNVDKALGTLAGAKVLDETTKTALHNFASSLEKLTKGNTNEAVKEKIEAFFEAMRKSSERLIPRNWALPIPSQELLQDPIALSTLLHAQIDLVQSADELSEKEDAYLESLLMSIQAKGTREPSKVTAEVRRLAETLNDILTKHRRVRQDKSQTRIKQDLHDAVRNKAEHLKRMLTMGNADEELSAEITNFINGIQRQVNDSFPHLASNTEEDEFVRSFFWGELRPALDELTNLVTLNAKLALVRGTSKALQLRISKYAHGDLGEVKKSLMQETKTGMRTVMDTLGDKGVEGAVRKAMITEITQVENAIAGMKPQNDGKTSTKKTNGNTSEGWTKKAIVMTIIAVCVVVVIGLGLAVLLK